MAKAFKKGQLAIYFMDIDRKGTWSWTRALVKSCGEKRMTLENAATGEMMGSHFRPDHSMSYESVYKGVTATHFYCDVTLLDMSDEEAEEAALKLAKEFLVREREALNLKLSNDAYNHQAVQKSIDSLHDPIVQKR